ncbi:MAG: beta-propeller domain-containing protein [Clostridia bacterium]|nr:beta-propeller domain-containing protein [Clostridia bacterium]
MKNKKLLDAFSLVDEKYVEEADPDRTRKRGAMWSKRLAYVAVAACLMLVIVLPILFSGDHEGVQVPSTSGAEGSSPADAYQDSEYYAIIKELMSYYKEQEELLGAPQPDAPLAGVDGVFTQAAVATVPAPSEPETPDDITDNQVVGVVEADLIKRTNTHIFYLRSATLEAYTIQGKDSAKIGSYSIDGRNPNGFYLLDNGKKALILTNAKQDSSATLALLLDVSDPANIKEIKQVLVSGHANTSRVTDEKILLFTNYFIEKDQVDYEKPNTFVPTVTENGVTKPLLSSDILTVSEHPFSASYSVVYALNPKTLEIEGNMALVGTWGQFYISKSHIVFAKNRILEEEKGAYRYWKQLTDIICLSYTDGMTEEGRITLDGYAKDQYSFDEKDGILRIVTTIREHVYKVHDPSGSVSGGAPSQNVVETTADPERLPASPEESTSTSPSSYTGASLYCVSLDSFEVVAKVERFAPNGETVQSVRFDGDYAYVCTSIVFTDPVFFFDLSDLSDITYTDTGVIEGYSSSLIGFGEGNLIGIGYENWDTVKIEAYREEDARVVSVDRYLIPSASIASDYKAYYVDRKHQLLGFGVYIWSGQIDEPSYKLLYFDGEKLTELVSLPMSGAVHTYRSVYLDGFLYVFGEVDFHVVEVTIPKV